MSASWPSLQGLNVTTHGVAVYPPLATFGPRRLTDYEFVWIIEGHAVAHLDDQRVEAPPGTVILSRAGMTDRYDWDTQHRTVHAFFHFQFESARGWPPPSDWPLARSLPEGDIIRPLFRYVLSVHPDNAPAAELLLRSFISGKVGTAPEPPMIYPPPVERALQAIRDIVYQTKPGTVTLADLAAAAHVTPEHLCRLFRRHLALGPLEALRLARLQFAATLLSRSNLTVKEVADASGFVSPYHFSRAFRQTYGVPPREYGAAVLANQLPGHNPIVRLLPLRP